MICERRVVRGLLQDVVRRSFVVQARSPRRRAQTMLWLREERGRTSDRRRSCGSRVSVQSGQFERCMRRAGSSVCKSGGEGRADGAQRAAGTRENVERGVFVSERRWEQLQSVQQARKASPKTIETIASRSARVW
jgi:hypothetical protein